ncbi:MAG: cytochrome P450, partial [Acidobacteriaceae bacterium]|nr:cytochrome P450 [Acidobacteriaceae bacterium]
IARTAIADDNIGGYHIPAKTVLIMSPYAAHRRAASWENPEGFDPERFSRDRSQNRHPFSYFPFGGGPRLCLGKRFASMEAELVLATIAQRWRLDVVPGPPIGTEPRISLRPRRKITMTLHAQPLRPSSTSLFGT